MRIDDTKGRFGCDSGTLLASEERVGLLAVVKLTAARAEGKSRKPSRSGAAGPEDRN